MNVYNNLQEIVEKALVRLQKARALPAKLDLSGVQVEPARDPVHGDVATNAALVLAGRAKMKPQELATKIAAELKKEKTIESADVAGPGFVNLRLSADFWRGQVPVILGQGAAYASSDAGRGEKINVEYVSANPTGPMHVGHVRGAVFGDALANLLAKAGYKVTREYYINDSGEQVDMLARSVFLRYREALGHNIGAIPEGLYPGDYLIPLAEELAREFGGKYADAAEAKWLPVFREQSVSAMMGLIKDDLAALGIEHEVFFSERSLHEKGLIAEVIGFLKKKGVIYKGVLDPPKGMRLEDWEPREQTLFRSTDFGDDVDRPLVKSDGSYTYFAADIAYHYDKFRRGFLKMIDMLAVDHGGYVKRIKAAVKAVSDGKADLDVKLCQLVKLYRGGEPVKMSKRAGQFITSREVVDEVGKDVLRFIMLTRKNDAPLDFDFEKVREQTRENPVFYVQYAHARAHSLFRKAREMHPSLRLEEEALAEAELHLLKEGGELAIIKALAGWPRVVEGAAEAHEPHRLAFALYDIASQFHAQWNKGNDEPALRFVLDNDLETTRARLAMVRAVALVIAEGLTILGVEPLEELR